MRIKKSKIMVMICDKNESEKMRLYINIEVTRMCKYGHSKAELKSTTNLVSTRKNKLSVVLLGKGF